MPRLPGIESVTRVSTDGLRLPALRAPAVDPTGAALEDFGPALTKFGKSLGDFAKKREAVKAAKDAAALRELDGDLTKLRTEISDTPPPDGSEDRGPDEPEPMKLRLEAYDQVAADRLEKFGDVSVRGQAESIVAEGRKALELRASIDGHNRDLGSIPTMLESTLDTVRATAARQPNMLEVSRERGLNALRETAKVLGWSDDVLRAHEQSFDRELFVGVIQGRIARGEGRGVLESLRDPEMKELFDDATIADLTQEAEARHGSEVAAILSGLDIHGERIARTGVGVEGLAEQAATTLPPEQHKTFLARERVSQSAHDFEKKFARKPRTVLEAELETSFPGELASEEDQETFGALRDKASAMFLERERDPAAVAGRDPVVEGLREAGRTEEASALALEIQNQMEIPAAQRRLLTNAEAQSKAAELNKMPAVMRAQALAAEREGDERHYQRKIAELSQQGLDRPAQALAAVVGNQALSDLLVSAQTQGRAKLRETATDEERAAVTSAVGSALDRIADEEGIDARGFRFVVEDLAFQFFNTTGEAETAAEDAAALFARQLGTFAPEERIVASDANAQVGKASIHLASATGENRGGEGAEAIPGSAGDDNFVVASSNGNINDLVSPLSTNGSEATQITPTEKDENGDELLDRTVAGFQGAAAAIGREITVNVEARNWYRRKIRESSQEFLDKLKSGEIPLNKETAKRASQQREKLLVEARERGTKLGKKLAENIKKSGRSFESFLERKSIKDFGKTFKELTESEKGQLWKGVVESSGRDNTRVTELTKRLGPAGKALILATFALAAYNIMESDDKLKTTAKEGVKISGGILGGMAGGAVAGLFCGPGAPVCSGIGVLVGGILGGLGVEVGIEFLEDLSSNSEEKNKGK